MGPARRIIAGPAAPGCAKVAATANPSPNEAATANAILVERFMIFSSEETPWGGVTPPVGVGSS
jgi:hypothetical protein